MTDSALFLAVADAAVRGTLVLLAALAATGLMRRSSASARHLVWLAALAALLLLPLAGIVGGGTSVGISLVGAASWASGGILAPPTPQNRSPPWAMLPQLPQ